MGITRNHADAFEILIAPYEKKIYFTCLHMMGNDADAQDCAQDAIFKAFRAYGRFRYDANFSSWVYRITSNVCIDALRKRRRDLSLDELQQNGLEIPSEQPSAYEVMVEKNLKEKITQALRWIPDDLRIALILRDLEGLRYDEISASLKIPTGTVKSRINRAREKLRKILLADMEPNMESTV